MTHYHHDDHSCRKQVGNFKEPFLQFIHYSRVLICVVLSSFLLSCSPPPTEDERLLKIIDATSVHLMLGAKVLMVNPNDDAKVKQVQKSLAELAERNRASETGEISLSQALELTQLIYAIKQFGEAELALGKSSDLMLFEQLAQQENAALGTLSKEQDHALFLIVLNLMKLNPTTPFPITDEQLLYESWIADKAQFDDKVLDSMLRASQVSAYAVNELCDLAAEQVDWFTHANLGNVDLKPLIAEVSQLSVALARMQAHVPAVAGQMIALVMLPRIFEIMPHALRFKAHLDTAQCFTERGQSQQARVQKEAALEVLAALGVVDAELALFRAKLAYESGDLDSAAKHLKTAATSERLDARTQQDLGQLANNIHSPEQGLVNEYLNKLNLAAVLAQIIHRRLSDEGVYQNLIQSPEYQRFKVMWQSAVSKVGM